ncbi:FKBP-type peptidyl-prolyl cis-trans isomerase [Salibacter halophilus]|jgi:FKBP-type peptidyl-prolyl cis-trans isomerase FklB|uniref:Peptidyl-prolyl cis-trans isomerase n=1 Tax=Salibacter halophilus TaxID=1803916 RepID=A0A6N6M579_9FLAO|nr:FKBP-type peptidyl-prolyl cis-trans isomerase [Salibacter halophilus]KAB1064545.1 FKBP-type peptidyl-prolyl cis-trans isomerase [Salibacter halophilus]
MKLKLLFSSALSLALIGTSCQQGGGSSFDGKLKSANDSVSYALGVNVASSMEQQGLDEINGEALSAAIKAINSGDSTKILMNNGEAMQFLQTYFAEMQEKKRKEEGSANKTKGQKFLEENKGKEGVEVTESGLQYKVIEMGDGKKPGMNDMVRVHYKGTLIDGSTFDSSYKRGEPAQFPVNGVIAGWTEALQLMPVGSKWELYIPYNLAYGEKGAGQQIPPYSTLIFEVELLEIVDKAQAQQGQPQR